MPEPLTDLERRTLDYLIEYLRTNTYQPSIREIGRTFSIKSTKTVSELLQSLADKGWIERDPSRSRGVRLLGIDLHTHAVSVPVDPPLQAVSFSADNLELDNRIAGRGTFLVVMSGAELDGSGIHHGDLLLVEPVTMEQLDDGDIVLALKDSVRIVRRFSHSQAPRLLADDPAVGPLAIGSNGVSVVGRVISVVRRLRAPASVPPQAAT